MLTQCVRAFHNDLLRDPFERPLALVPKQIGQISSEADTLAVPRGVRVGRCMHTPFEPGGCRITRQALTAPAWFKPAFS